MSGKSKSLNIIRQSLIFAPDSSRVITKKFSPGTEERIASIIDRILLLNKKQTEEILKETIGKFSNRHNDIERIFKDNFDRIEYTIDEIISLEKKLLIGSYFTMEYSIESVALFNPSIVPHPDQNKLNEGELRIIISFRAVGEGHMSSIVFRKGVIKANGNVVIDEKSGLVENAIITPDKKYNKVNFVYKLKDINCYDLVSKILDNLLDPFTFDELVESIKIFKKQNQIKSLHNEAIDTLIWLAKSNYEIQFNKNLSLSGRVIFPNSKNERKGLEDARFVHFKDEDGSERYYATYSAYNGITTLPQLIETEDFSHFKISTLNGSGSQNKGMALFPEKINGKYAIISRYDNENLYILFSDNVRYWNNPVLLREPEFYWEFFQIGNSGSPLKTDKGWLLLTHGVGPVRTYCLGALLLDLNDPAKVIGALKNPLLVPLESERNGYVPNVVYTCGAIIHNDYLVIPYAVSDSQSSIAKIKLDDVLNCMEIV